MSEAIYVSTITNYNTEASDSISICYATDAAILGSRRFSEMSKTALFSSIYWSKTTITTKKYSNNSIMNVFPSLEKKFLINLPKSLLDEKRYELCCLHLQKAINYLWLEMQAGVCFGNCIDHRNIAGHTYMCKGSPTKVDRVLTS